MRIAAPDSVSAVRHTHPNAFSKGTPLARHVASPRTLAAIFREEETEDERTVYDS